MASTIHVHGKGTTNKVQTTTNVIYIIFQEHNSCRVGISGLMKCECTLGMDSIRMQ